MKLLILLLATQLIISCSSTTKSSKAGKNLASESQDSFPQISNEDFNQPNPLPYLAHEDNFERIQQEKPFNDLLITESIYRLDKRDWEKVADASKEFKDSLSRMISLCYLKKFDEAYSLSDQIYNQYKEHPTYWNQLGTCYFLQGSRSKAILFYNKALEINKDYSPALNNLGILYIHSHKDQKAFLAFKLAKEKGPFSLTPLFNMAFLYLKYGFIQNAYELFRVLYRRDSRDKDVVAGLAHCELLQGNIENSIKLFSSIDSSNYHRPEISLNYSLALKLAKRDKEAKEILRKVEIELNNSWKEYYSRVSQFVEE